MRPANLSKASSPAVEFRNFKKIRKSTEKENVLLTIDCHQDMYFEFCHFNPVFAEGFNTPKSPQPSSQLNSNPVDEWPASKSCGAGESRILVDAGDSS